MPAPGAPFCQLIQHLPTSAQGMKGVIQQELEKTVKLQL